MTLLDLFCGVWLPCLTAPRLPPVRAVGVATVFHVHDRDNPNIALGCVRAARRLGLRDLRDDLPIVAMRDVDGPPCGTLIYVERAGRVALTIRLDSGPHGRDTAGVFRGLIDLSPAVARAIELPGSGVNRRGIVAVRWSQ